MESPLAEGASQSRITLEPETEVLSVEIFDGTEAQRIWTVVL
jgi:hypothetical protein